MQELDPEGRAFGDPDSYGSDRRYFKIQKIKSSATRSLSCSPFKSAPQHDKPETRPCALCPACKETISCVRDIVERYSEGEKYVWRPGEAATSHLIALNYNYDQLQVSALHGCHLCSLLEVSLLGYLKDGQPALFPQRNVEDDIWLYMDVLLNQHKNVLCSIKMGVCCYDLEGTFGELIDILPDDKQSAVTTDSTIPPGRSTNDEESFTIIQQWLGECVRSHPRCQSDLAHPGIPKTLLHLDIDHVRIVENLTQSPYICLSHCWGPEAQIPTSMKNGGSMKVMEIVSLPQNFQDAVEITEKLGYEYLWIDSFCITQTSKEDWLDQSAVMARIYAHAEFTIAVLASQGPSYGCFRARNPLHLRPLQLDGLKIQHRYPIHG